MNVFARTALKNTLATTSRHATRASKPAAFRVSSTRSVVTVASTKYTAHATAQGFGRNGEVSSNGLDLKLATPKELGGSGQGQNPEQLFAMGYSACLLGAIQAVAGKQGKKDQAAKAVVHASVNIGLAEGLEGFAISVDMKVEGVDDELLKAGHEFCPYSRILKHGAVVNVSKA